MQSAEAVLGVLRERGRRGLPCDELYRQLFNPQLYLLAYGRIYSNHGAMTAGATKETVDGMSLGKIDRIIDAMRNERYRFNLVGQAGRRGSAPAAGGLLRATVLRPFPRVPSRPGLPHRAPRGGQHLDRDELVHRGRHLRLLRIS